MLIVGELINTSRSSLNEAVEARDVDYIQKIALEQVEAGAGYIDVNCGNKIHNEIEIMEWLVNTVQEVTETPLCIDSPNPLALEASLALAKFGQPMVNSISGEKERFEGILPLVLKYKAKVVALCNDDKGVPETAEDRMRVVDSLYARLVGAGVVEDDIYFDPLIKPVSSIQTAGLEVLQTLKLISEKYPKVHKICGLSNVSYGLPARKVLNRLFMVQTMTLGMDAYILNPNDKEMMGFVYASKALLGNDFFCADYLAAYRKGLYN